jgi:FPC/CPF motif-containing protein YcgG
VNAPVPGAPLWDPQQREILAAMGLPVYRALGTTTADTASAAVVDDPLIAALLRAAGRSRDAQDAAQLVRGWPTPQALRRDPRAKRALWPALRALRRSPA